MWLRLYTEVRHDRKLRRISPAKRWLWIAILAIAKESPKPGWLLLAEGVPLTIDDLPDEAAIPRSEVEDAIRYFKKQHMLEEDDGVLHCVNWDKRQFTSDNVTSRVQKHRRNVSETLQERSGNVSETPPDTDTDTDIDIDRKSASPETEKPEEPLDPLATAYKKAEEHRATIRDKFPEVPRDLDNLVKLYDYRFPGQRAMAKKSNDKSGNAAIITARKVFQQGKAQGIAFEAMAEAIYSAEEQDLPPWEIVKRAKKSPFQRAEIPIPKNDPKLHELLNQTITEEEVMAEEKRIAERRRARERGG